MLFSLWLLTGQRNGEVCGLRHDEIADDIWTIPAGRTRNGLVQIVPSHDLRRTVGTRLSALGFNRLILDKAPNHKDTSVGGIYDRYSYDDEKREALESWASELSAILR